MEKESQRVIETKGKIKDAFIELCLRKKLDKISVKELTDLANINRGTFYVYYQDIYDLQEKIEDEFYDKIKGNVEYILTGLLTGEDFTKNMPSLDFFISNKEYVKVFLNNKGDFTIVPRIKKLAKSLLKKKLFDLGQGESEQVEYIIEYITSAQIGMITHWVQQDFKAPVDELGRIIRAVNLKGPITYLIQLKNSES